MRCDMVSSPCVVDGYVSGGLVELFAADGFVEGGHEHFGDRRSDSVAVAADVVGRLPAVL